jgi:5-methylthioadenosine/S-adenosylhomocysteine deaminase
MNSSPGTELQQADIVISGGTVIAFDGTEHRRLDNGVIAIRGDRIVHVGRQWAGGAARRIDASGKIVIPGQISTHAHIGAHEGPRLLIDGGRRNFLRSGFLHFVPARRTGGPGFYAPQDTRASLRYGFATLLRHGITTALAFGPAGREGGETMMAVAAEFGIRLVWSPIASGGRYWLEDDGAVTQEMDEAAGLKALEQAARFIDRHKGANDGRYSGAIVLDEYHLSTPDLRREAKRLSRALGVPFTMHFVEQHREFFETMARTGKTPVELLADEGVLDSQTILAHTIYLSCHSLVGYPLADDIGILGSIGVHVAHSPVAFSRRGVALESFDRYRRAGIGVALATDAYPLDMFAEMRTAAIMGKVAERNYEAANAADVFSASNLAGAAALGRPDLGRIAIGAKADLVVIDPATLTFGANPDPVRAIVHLAQPENVDSVMVDGRLLVEGRKITIADEGEILAAVTASSQRIWNSHAGYDPLGRSVDQAFPPALRDWPEA